MGSKAIGFTATDIFQLRPDIRPKFLPPIPKLILFFSFSFRKIRIDESATNELGLASTRMELWKIIFSLRNSCRNVKDKGRCAMAKICPNVNRLDWNVFGISRVGLAENHREKQLGNAPLGTGSLGLSRALSGQKENVPRQTSFDKKSWIDYHRRNVIVFSFFLFPFLVEIKKATSTLREPFRSFYHRKRSRFNALKSPNDGSFLDAIAIIEGRRKRNGRRL